MTTPSPSNPALSPTPPLTFAKLRTREIIIPPGNNGRGEPDPQRVTWLAGNISTLGLLNPITVRNTLSAYELVAGLGRLLAVRQLGWDLIPACILDGDDNTAALARLSENVTRSNLTPVDEAVQLHGLVESHPRGTHGVADDLGRPRSWVEDRLDILTWPNDLIAFVHAKKITLAAAKHLARIQDPVTQQLYTATAAENGITARTASDWRRQAAGQEPAQIETSKNGATVPQIAHETEIRVVCFACNESKRLDDTQSAHVCSACIHLVNAAMNQTPTAVLEHDPRP